MSASMSTKGCGGCPEARRDGGPLPADPFRSVRYHYGMLLGEEDFVTDQAYHRGKHRLHNAWLHGSGVLWGLEVSILTDVDGSPTGDLQVGPGLALDPLGQELTVDTLWCVNVGQWLERHGDDEGLEPTSGGVDEDEVAFDAHVVACFRTCLSRPVPAMVDPCESAATDVACSRVVETVHLELRPGRSPKPPAPPSRPLRILFGLETEGDTPTEAESLAAERRKAVLTGADPDACAAAFLRAFREVAALHTLEAGRTEDGTPAIHPQVEEPCVLLADVTGLSLVKDGDTWRLTGGTVDPTVRPTLLSTALIQELLCGAPCRTAPAGGGALALRATAGAPDAGGPRIDPASVRLKGKKLSFSFDGVVVKRSLLDPGALSVTTFDAEKGWRDVAITAPSLVNKDGRTVVGAVLDRAPADGVVRLIVRGTGPRPVLARSGTGPFLPLAGAVGGPPAGPHDGRDFVHMLRARS